MTQKPGECNIFITVKADFIKIRSHMYLAWRRTDRFSGQKFTGQGHIRQKHNCRRQAIEFYLVFHVIGRNFAEISQKCIHIRMRYFDLATAQHYMTLRRCLLVIICQEHSVCPANAVW